MPTPPIHGADKAIAGLGAAGEGVGVELRAQPIDAGDGHGTIRGHVLPAIGQRAGDIGLAGRVAHEGAGLEQVGAAAAAVRHAEAGAAAGQRKARDGVWREEIIRAGGDAEDAAGAGVRSERRIAVGGLRAAEAGAPTTLQRGSKVVATGALL